jgi:hypothetical protein
MTDKERIEALEKENKLLQQQAEQYKKINQQSDKLSSNTKSLYDENEQYIGTWTMNVGTIAKRTEQTIESMVKQMASPFDPGPFEELDNRATSLQNTFASTKGQLEGYKQIIADTIPELTKMGISEEQAVKNIGEVMESMGSNAVLGTEAITEISAAAKISGIEAGKLASNFRDVGISVYDVGDRMKEVTDIARGAGVSATAVSQKVSANLSSLNLYNFDNGVKGLAKMAVTSERLGISMNRVFDFAEQIFDPEGAIEMAAGLQRLGVTASGLLDPLKAMDLAANDPEGLQKEIINVTKEFTKFNEANGQFEIMPGSKRRLREIAKEMKIPVEELASMSIKAADFDMKMKQIQFPSLATDQETKEMIAGMAQLKDGKAQINVKNEQTGEVELKQVDQLTATDIESLKKSQEEDSMTIEEVAKAQLSVSQQIEQNTKSAISGIRMGKATTEPLEKMFTTVMGAQVDLSRNIANSVSSKGTRQTLTAIGQPMEDYIVGGVTGNEQMQKDSTKDFLAALDVTEQRIKAGSQEFLTTTLTDISNRFKEAYSQPQKIETKSDVNFNMTINGNDNVKNMDLNAIKGDIVNYLTQTAEGKDLLKKAIENPNAPSAMVGSKN